ncbi:uncharacterized protein DNG_08750 [Cephalotrichum gorgonifer]|uniref:Uncharacterized protein n=1 Tax=Cephalotrichum gorgonifer TaxID=2041049 RepID=A0AAE8SYN5_9PEZI|nr:uncharacterized protein DNG_08750 [Cephalotrichum gorgonifer]
MACSKSRLDTSAFCNHHACQYSGCAACKQGVGTTEGAIGDACKEHTCQAEGCFIPRRTQRPYCREHSCRWSGRVPCNQPVEAGSMACRDHVCQYEEGCANVRRVKSNSHACDDHTCAAPRCYQAAGLRRKYCAEHTCIWDPCSKKGGEKGSPYCETHKCRVSTCAVPIASKVDWFCEHHKCRYAGGTCAGGWSEEPPFCKEHTCKHEGCSTPVRRGGQYCLPHTCIVRLYNEPCVRGRKAGGQFCLEHSCTKSKCTEPRESGSTTRCAKHPKDDMYYMYVSQTPRPGEKAPHRKKTKGSPRGSSSSLDEPRREDVETYGAKQKQKGARARTPSRAPLYPDAGNGIMTAVSERGRLVPSSRQMGVVPPKFRANPDQKIAYLEGVRDTCFHLADAAKAQIERTARPLSPSRHMPRFDGPRITSLGDESS